MFSFDFDRECGHWRSKDDITRAALGATHSIAASFAYPLKHFDISLIKSFSIFPYGSSKIFLLHWTMVWYMLHLYGYRRCSHPQPPTRRPKSMVREKMAVKKASLGFCSHLVRKLWVPLSLVFCPSSPSEIIEETAESGSKDKTLPHEKWSEVPDSRRSEVTSGQDADMFLHKPLRNFVYIVNFLNYVHNAYSHKWHKNINIYRTCEKPIIGMALRAIKNVCNTLHACLIIKYIRHIKPGKQVLHIYK